MSYSVIGIMDALVRFYSTLILVYVILSWFPATGLAGDIRRVLGTIVEPWLGIFRRIVPMVGAGGGGIDFSPIVALLVLQFGWGGLLRPLLASAL